MASKPKKAKVVKARSATQERKELPKQDKKEESSKPTSVEALTIQNGQLIEQLLSSRPWVEIVKPLLDESIAGVSGRFTNGRYWHGTLTTKWDENTSLALAFYQKALMEFYNNIHDFVVAKDKLLRDKKQDELDKSAPIYNPFMEDSNGT